MASSKAKKKASGGTQDSDMSLRLEKLQRHVEDLQRAQQEQSERLEDQSRSVGSELGRLNERLAELRYSRGVEAPERMDVGPDSSATTEADPRRKASFCGCSRRRTVSQHPKHLLSREEDDERKAEARPTDNSAPRGTAQTSGVPTGSVLAGNVPATGNQAATVSVRPFEDAEEEEEALRGRISARTLTRPWLLEQVGRPKRLILVRHGESQGNVDRNITQKVPDNALHLTPKGRQEALSSGRRLKQLVGEESVRFYVSPYVRAVETFNGLAEAFGGAPGLRYIEEPQIREIEYGNFDRPDINLLHKEKSVFGPFFYRFPEGESIADVYDRASLFLESLYRQWHSRKEDNFVVVGHGVMLLVFLQRLLGFTVEEFFTLERLENCEIIVLNKDQKNYYQVRDACSLRDGFPDHRGLRRKASAVRKSDIWNGSLKHTM